MEWSNDTVLHFLQLYKNEPVIWDISNDDHKNRMKVYDAWKRISVKLGDEEKYNVPELKRKKESLMASFRLYTKKVKESKRSGDGPYKPVWFAYEPMRKFLGDKYKPRSPLTSEVRIN